MMRNPFHGFLEIFKDECHVWSSARFCAIFILPCVYIAVWRKCDAGVVSALVVGGIGALTVRVSPFQKKSTDGKECEPTK